MRKILKSMDYIEKLRRKAAFKRDYKKYTPWGKFLLFSLVLTRRFRDEQVQLVFSTWNPLAWILVAAALLGFKPKVLKR